MQKLTTLKYIINIFEYTSISMARERVQKVLQIEMVFPFFLRLKISKMFKRSTNFLADQFFANFIIRL